MGARRSGEVFCGSCRGNGRAIASLDSSIVGGPACGAEGWLVQDTSVEADQTFADAVVVVVQVAQSQIIEGEVLVHEERHLSVAGGIECVSVRGPARLASSKSGIHMPWVVSSEKSRRGSQIVFT